MWGISSKGQARWLPSAILAPGRLGQGSPCHIVKVCLGYLLSLGLRRLRVRTWRTCFIKQTNKQIRYVLVNNSWIFFIRIHHHRLWKLREAAAAKIKTILYSKCKKIKLRKKISCQVCWCWHLIPACKKQR